jgi:hypothetical protein
MVSEGFQGPWCILHLNRGEVTKISTIPPVASPESSADLISRGLGHTYSVARTHSRNLGMQILMLVL